MHRPADDTLRSIPRPLSVPYALPLTQKPRRRLVLWPWILLAITAFGTWLRFYRIEFPALWNDETLVFWRVCGTYGQMLRPLSTDGFPPLHYSLYWLMGHPVPVEEVVARGVLGVVVMFFLAGGTLALMALLRTPCSLMALLFVPVLCLLAALCAWKGPVLFYPHPLPVPHPRTAMLTPFVMRFPVALSGALTIPAMYFLARQLVDRRTSMIVALFTACSAFMLFYSRDAKMYADLWLFETLNVGCLLWWLRTGKSTPWLCWVASGCAMIGLHATGYVPVALSIVIWFTQTKAHWKTGLAWVAGLALVLAGPLGYVLKFSRWVEKVEDKDVVDFAWVNWYNGERTGTDLALYGTSTFLNGWEWPRDDYVDKLKPYDPDDAIYKPKPHQEQEIHRPEPILPPFIEGPKTAFQICAILLAIGLIPWPRRWRSPETSLDPPTAWRFQTFLWIGLWLMAIGYGFYCHGVEDFSPPTVWLAWLADYFTPAGVAAVTGGIVIGTLICGFRLKWWPAVGRLGMTALVAAVIFGSLYGISKVMAKELATEADDAKKFVSAWLPRYLGIMWPAFAIAVAALVMRLPSRPLRTATVVFLMATNLSIFGLRMTLGSEPPIDKLVADEWASQDRKSTVRCYDGVESRQYGGDIAVAGTTMAPGHGPDGIAVDGGRYYLQILANRTPMSPSLFNLSLGNQIRPENRYNLREFMTPQEIKADLDSSPQVKTMILWTRIGPNDNPTRAPWCGIHLEGPDHQVQKEYSGPYNISPKQWRQTKEETFTVRIPWEWRERCVWIRREYTRVEPAGTGGK